MRILSWNCRGVGRALTIRAIKTLARSEGPDVLFLSKTKINSPKVDRLKRSLGFADSFCLDYVGRAGDLALFWKLGVDLEVIFANHFVVVHWSIRILLRMLGCLLMFMGRPICPKRRNFGAYGGYYFFFLGAVAPSRRFE